MNRKYKQRIRQQYKDNIFMKQLSSELRNQPNDYNAAPVFWVIQDYKDILTHDDFGDFIKVVDYEYGCEYHEKEFIERAKEEYDLEDYELEKCKDIDELDIKKLVSYINRTRLDGGLAIYSFSEVPYIKEDTMFLTKQEAKNHLKNNKHH